MNREGLLIQLLNKGDLRTIGAAEQVVEAVRRDPTLVAGLVEGMVNSEAGVRMRAADALQKAAGREPSLIKPYKQRLLEIASTANQKEVQWHCAQLVRSMSLMGDEIEAAGRFLVHYLKDSSSAIVRAEAVESLACLAIQDPSRRSATLELISLVEQTGSAAVVARCRKARLIMGT